MALKKNKTASRGHDNSSALRKARPVRRHCFDDGGLRQSVLSAAGTLHRLCMQVPACHCACKPSLSRLHPPPAWALVIAVLPRLARARPDFFFFVRRTLSHIWRPFNRRSAAVQAGLGEGERRPLAGSRVSMHSSNGPLSSARGACSQSSAAPCACDCVAVRCFIGCLNITPPCRVETPFEWSRSAAIRSKGSTHSCFRFPQSPKMRNRWVDSNFPSEPRCVENSSAVLLQ